MNITADIIADSISEHGVRLTTFSLTYPRIIHGEVMTHRVFSRNAMSSRAIPVSKLISEVWNDPFIPMVWGSNKPGMQAGAEVTGARRALAKFTWVAASKAACVFAWGLSKLGLHKQIGNRILEPFQWMRTVVTATEWDNFFELRAHPDAEPHFQGLAKHMQFAMDISIVRELRLGQWHLPYVDSVAMLDCKISAARCARVSYLTHEGRTPSVEADLALYERLAGSDPKHLSPLEHQATPALSADTRSGNLTGWIQFRQII
jgi:hypothetical protein